nr:nuclear transport factor 2 family protein [Chthonobacter rhizosphaerae]
MPLSIQTYFDAEAKNDGNLLIQGFAPDAVVRDEGRVHVGRGAIRAWWHDAKAKYQHQLEPVGVTETGDIVAVRVAVTGRFPGSPATLGFVFRTRGDRIAELEIGG